MHNELAFVRLGVDRTAEEREVRRMLAQRRLHVVADVESPAFAALGAESMDGKTSAVRVISARGIVLAEDGSYDDLFDPSRVILLEGLPPRFADMDVLAVQRVGRGRDTGCTRLFQVLGDGSVVEVPLDMSTLGPRACVVELGSPSGSSRISARVGFVGLAAEQTPLIQLELSMVPVLLGQPVAAQRSARIADVNSFLGRERERLGAPVPSSGSFSDQHALGVSRAALALLAGEDRDAQLAAYRGSVAGVRRGSADATLFAETQAHIERGWLDDQASPEGANEAEPGDVIVAPPSEPGPDDAVIEPE